MSTAIEPIEKKRLCRSESDRMIAGVCGGIAEYFGWDSTLVRLIFIMVILLGGSGIVAYLVLWFILPSASESLDASKPSTKISQKPAGGVFLIGLGCLLLLQNFGIVNYLQLDKTWPVVLVIAGFLLLSKK